jgi:hypothetical protein
MFTRKPHLQLEKFAINCAKRLLQQNLHNPEAFGCANEFCLLGCCGLDVLAVSRSLHAE